MRDAIFTIERRGNASSCFKAWATVSVAVYALLLVLSAACSLDATLDDHHHAHADSHSSAHTTLCNWSCQLSSSPAIISLGGRTLPDIVLTAIPIVLNQGQHTGAEILPDMRGPPPHLSES